jgi:hypothetical protein
MGGYHTNLSSVMPTSLNQSFLSKPISLNTSILPEPNDDDQTKYTSEYAQHRAKSAMRRKKVKPQMSKSLMQGTGQLKDSKYESNRPTPTLEDRITMGKLKHSP